MFDQVLTVLCLLGPRALAIRLVGIIDMHTGRRPEGEPGVIVCIRDRKISGRNYVHANEHIGTLDILCFQRPDIGNDEAVGQEDIDSIDRGVVVLLCHKLTIACKYVSFVTWPNMMPLLLPASMST